MKRIPEQYYGLLPVLLLCLLYAYKAIDYPAHDFSNYYFGGYFLGKGNFNATVYFPYWFNQSISDLGYPGLFTSYAPNTPFLALLFSPMAFLPLSSAKLIFNSISILLFLHSLKELVSHYKIKKSYLFLIPVLFFVPIKNELLFGQVYFLLFYLLAKSWLAYEKEEYKKTGFFLGLAILLKIFPIILLLVFLSRKQFKPVIFTLVTCLALCLLTLFFISLDAWVFFFQSVLPKASNGEISGSFVINYQSVFMFLKEFLVFEPTENPNSFFNDPGLFSALILTFKIGLTATGIYISKKITDPLFIFSYWILAAILVSPYGSTYTFILLLFPFLSIGERKISMPKKAFLLALLFLTNNLPLKIFMDNAFPFSYFRLLFLLLFFFPLFSIAYKAIHWKAVALILLASVIPVFLMEKKDTIQSVCLLPKNSPILVYDYKIDDNKLTYFYWNENGKNAKSIPIEMQNPHPAELKDNQVFYGKKQLTFENSNKLKPLLINAKTIIYLSDYDRGIGFYTLRRIDLSKQ